jgi:RNA recognition motif-containing protein
MPLSERQIPPGIDSRRVYVGNLGWGVAWQDLKDHMRKAGEVIRAEVILFSPRPSSYQLS